MSPRDEAVYTLRIERELLDQLREIAKREHRSLAEKFRVMVEQEIASSEGA